MKRHHQRRGIAGLAWIVSLVWVGFLLTGLRGLEAIGPEKSETENHAQKPRRMVIGRDQSFLVELPPVANRLVIRWDTESIKRSSLDKNLVGWHELHVKTALELVYDLYYPWMDPNTQGKLWKIGVTLYEDRQDLYRQKIQGNAFFLPQQNSLVFSFIKIDLRRGSKGPLCQSLDVVSHEAGHGLLHHVNPGMGSTDFHAGALGESFGDLTAFFVREKFRIEPYSARKHTCLGSDVGMCIRSLRHDQTLFDHGKTPTSCEIHELSKPFTGAIIEAYEGLLENRSFSPQQVLGTMVEAYATAFFTLGATDVYFEDITRNMMKISSKLPTLKRALGQSFIKRGFLEVDPRGGIYITMLSQIVCKKPLPEGKNQIRRVTPKKKRYVLVS